MPRLMFAALSSLKKTSLIASVAAAVVIVPTIVFFVDRNPDEPDDFISASCLFDYSLPSETLTHYATFADQLSVIKVASDRLEPRAVAPDGDPVTTEYFSRFGMIEIEETLWRRDGAPVAPDSFETTMLKQSDTKRVWITADTRLEVGERYLAALTRFEDRTGDDNDKWAPMTRCAVFPLDGDVIAEPAFVTYAKPDPIADQLVGMSVETFAEHLANTPPDASAERLWSVWPEHRQDGIAQLPWIAESLRVSEASAQPASQ